MSPSYFLTNYSELKKKQLKMTSELYTAFYYLCPGYPLLEWIIDC